MTKPRKLPNNCKAVMERSDEIAVDALKLLKPIVAGKNLSEKQMLQAVSLAALDCQQIARMVESAGVKPTDPLSESF